MQHKLLLRQVWRAFGVTSAKAWQERLGGLRARGDAALADGLVALLTATEHTYQGYERDLTVRTRMLEISSEELTSANDQLHAEAARQRAVLLALQLSVQRLTYGGAPSAPEPAPSEPRAFDAELLRLTDALDQLVRQREQAREQLGAAEAANRRILNSLREVVFQTDLAGRWVFLNPAWQEITGFELADTLGRRALSFVHPEDKRAHLAGLKALIERDDQYFRQRMRHRTAAGQYRWLEVFARRIEDEQGRAVGVSGSMIDITEQKLAQDRLSDSEQRLHQALQATDSRLWDWDLRQSEPYVDPAWLRSLGYTSDDLARGAVEWARKLHPDDLVRWRSHLSEHLRGRRAELDIELRFVTGDGQWRYALLRGKVVAWKGRKAVRMAGTLQDISLRKQAEQAALRQQALTEQILDQLPIPVFLKDRAGRFVRFNRQFQIFSQFTRAEMLGRTIGEFASRGWAVLTDAEDEQAWRSGLMVSSERRLTNVEPARDFLINRIVINSGGEAYLLGFAIDMSAPRAARAAMQLAVESAEAASRAKSEFLANMSHEIRTPMNGILGLTELVLDSPLAPQQRADIALVKASADALLTIINDILDFSKIEAGKLELEQVPFDLRQLVNDTTRAMALHARQKGLTLACALAPELPAALCGDPGRLRQVLVNLLGNAIKFTEHGGVELTLRVVALHDAHCEVEFAVRDSGIGIPPDKQKLIFEAFAQVDGSTTREYGGTGLGLTICRRLVTLMQGRIELDSAVGAGSNFRVVVPLGVAELERAPLALLKPLAAPLPASDAAASAPAQGGLRILLAEDNPINQRMALRLLEKMGHRVTLVDNGHVAVQRATSAPFDLMLMDVQMPGLDGISAARQIRSWEARHGGHVPIIAMTARAMQGDRERCLEAGMDDYISKPIAGAQLRRMISHFEGTPELPVLDWRAALHRLDGDAELLLELAALFLDDAPALLQELRAGLAAQQPDQAERTLHSLRGVLVTFGAERALAQADQLAARLYSIPAGADGALCVDALAGALDDACASLRALLAGGAPTSPA